jgi:hypothetical protein
MRKPKVAVKSLPDILDLELEDSEKIRVALMSNRTIRALIHLSNGCGVDRLLEASFEEVSPSGLWAKLGTEEDYGKASWYAMSDIKLLEILPKLEGD